jgi:hypothetical protein
VLEITRKFPLAVSAFMIIGFPEERIRDVLQTYRYLLRPVTAARAMGGVLRNRPRSRFERLFSFRLWHSSPTLDVRIREK